MQFVRPQSTESMRRLVESVSAQEPTYADIGATLAGTVPDGFRHDHYDIVLGEGTATFQRGVSGLQSWRAHRSQSIRVFPDGVDVQVGNTVVVTFGTPFLALAAPCRIVQVVDEPDRWGFAYGTLPGHPEQGEEAFVITRSRGGEVRFEVTAFSRPGNALVRLSGPFGRAMQTRGTKGYLRALRQFVHQEARRAE